MTQSLTEVAGLIERVKQRVDIIRRADTYTRQANHALPLGFLVEQHAETILSGLEKLTLTEAPEPLVERVARAIGKVLGLELDEVCGITEDAGECDSSTCPGALTEDHDAEDSRETLFRMARAALSSITTTEPGGDEEGPCTDCDDTGITIQTERRCACQPPLTTTEDSGEVVQADRLLAIAKRNLRQYLSAASFKCEADRTAALNCLEVMEDSLSGQEDQVAVLRSAFAASEQLRDRIASQPSAEREKVVAEIASECAEQYETWMAEGCDAADAIRFVYGIGQLARTALASMTPAAGEVGGDEYRLMLLDLLAVIHRDGGHKTQEIGIKLAWEQAMRLSSDRLAAVTATAPASVVDNVVASRRAAGCNCDFSSPREADGSEFGQCAYCDDCEKLEAAIRRTEYKYFGDYEMSDDQREAVDVLVEFARTALATPVVGVGDED